MHLGVVSVILFWAMMQMGIAVTVACLPTLRPLFHGFSPESIIHSIRSRVSLQSLRGKGSDHPYNKNSNNKPGTSRSDSFTALAYDAIYAGGEADIRTFIMGEVDKRKEEESLPQRGIKVETKISRSFEQS